jgi:PucR family transcriptional regulator, purine catabolism regulatory protein
MNRMNKSSPAAQVTLAEVMRLVLPLSSEVAGAADTGRQVSWVAVLTEWDDLPGQVQAGDIVILPPGLQEQSRREAVPEAVPLLARMAVAALMLFRPPSPAVLQAAVDSDLTLLIINDPIPLRDAHQGIAGLLSNRPKQTAERGMQLYRRLTEMSREGQGLEAMTGVMARLTGKIVAVQDKRLELLALSIPPGSPVSEAALRQALAQKDNLPGDLHNRKEVASTAQSHWQQMLPIGERRLARLVSPIISGDRARGYVSVIGPPDGLDLLDALTSEHGAAAIALEMAKAKAVSEARKAMRGDFLERLLAGRLPAEEVERLAARLDHDTGGRHAIVTFAWDGQDPPSMRRLDSPLNWLLSSHSRPALSHIYGNEHVCLFQTLEDGDAGLSTAADLARRLRDHLRAEFPHLRLVAGLSGPALTLADWPRVHRQAVQAMELARRLKIDQPVNYEQMGVYRLLLEMEHLPPARRFCLETIGPLVDYDRGHKSDLVQTLAAYFDNNTNTTQTAERLFIHRNTLLYRLERIQELIGQDLEQPDTRLALHLALKLWQLLPAEVAD